MTSGSYDQTFDMTAASSFNATFVTNNGGTPASAFAALRAGMDAGKAYLNIHSSFASGGEIRGFLAPIPEPESYALMLAGLGRLVIEHWRVNPALLGPLSNAQVTSLALIALGAAGWLYFRSRPAPISANAGR